MRERKWGVPDGCPVPMVAVALALFSAFSSHAQSTAVVARAAGVTGQAILLTPGLTPLVFMFAGDFDDSSIGQFVD